MRTKTFLLLKLCVPVTAMELTVPCTPAQVTPEGSNPIKEFGNYDFSVQSVAETNKTSKEKRAQ
jgi:hypothetical protein